MMQIEQKKDIFSRQCSLFLSNYIWVYSGYGPKRSGIRRFFIYVSLFSHFFLSKFTSSGLHFHHTGAPFLF